MHWVSLVSLIDKVLVSDEGIKLRLFEGNLVGTILINLYGSTLGIYVGTDLGSLDEPFDYSNYCNIGGLLRGNSLGYTGGYVIRSFEGIKLGYTDGKLVGAILVSQWVPTQ